MEAVRWLNPEGHRLDLSKSVEENGLEDGDMLQGRVEQLGGAALPSVSGLNEGLECMHAYLFDNASEEGYLADEGRAVYQGTYNARIECGLGGLVAAE